MDNHFNVVIAGAGPVGLAFALSLGGGGRRIRILEARASITGDTEERKLAISHGSKLILERLHAWPKDEDVTPIESIHVSHRGGFGSTVLTAEEARVPLLGYVVSYGVLLKKMNAALVNSDIELTTNAKVRSRQSTSNQASVEFEVRNEKKQITADLVAIADGGCLHAGLGDTDVRERDYHQQAVLGYVETEIPHENRAYERFTLDGPVALLPYGKGFCLVWTADPDNAQRLLELEDDEFLARLHSHFGDRLGCFTVVKDRKSIPLKLKYTKRVSAQRTAILGNAAQMVHPVAGQGLNLGIRDAAELAQEILSRPQSDLGSGVVLSAYEKRRRVDRMGGIFFTDFLVRLYSNDIPPLRFVRGIGLASLNCMPFAKQFLMHRMMFGATS